jgi:hypothetical protein
MACPPLLDGEDGCGAGTVEMGRAADGYSREERMRAKRGMTVEGSGWEGAAALRIRWARRRNRTAPDRRRQDDARRGQQVACSK